MSFGAENCQEGHNRANAMTGFRGKAHAPMSFANRWQSLQTKIAPCQHCKICMGYKRGLERGGTCGSAQAEQHEKCNTARHDHWSSVWWTYGALPDTAASPCHGTVACGLPPGMARCCPPCHSVGWPMASCLVWGGPKDLTPIGKCWSKSCVPLSAVTAGLTTRYCTEPR